jgi:predicted transposase/invertase (TIGR01784 family)
MKAQSFLSEVSMQVNEKLKSSVFSTLFSNPAVLRELYSAIEGVDIPPDTPIDINTLDKVLSKGQINDLSFTIDNRLVILIEHQSTINNNMPLRLLLYISEVYQNIIDHKALFNKKLVKIPTPQFIVLYNGKDHYDDRKELRLSEAFKDIEGLKLPDNNANSLELTVQVYNINYGRNSDILKKCATLDGYSIFVEKIREYNREIPIEKSVTLAVEYCIENNILKPFMEKHRLEVVKMLLEDITVEDEIEAAKEEAREEGWEEGREEVLELLKQGLSIEEIEKQIRSNSK